MQWRNAILNWLELSLGWCVPPELRQDQESFFRSLLFIVSAWAMFLFLILAVFVRLVLAREVTPITTILLLAAGGVGLSPLALRFSGQVSLAGRGLTWFLAVMMFVVAYLGLGVNAIVLLMMPVVVLFRAFFVGPRSAMWFSLLLAVSAFVLLLLQQSKMLPRHYLNPLEISLQMRVLALSLIAIYTSFLAFLFEWSRERVSRRLEKRDERYSFAARVGHEGVFDWDALSNEVHLTENYAALLGYGPGALLLSNPFDRRLVAVEDHNMVEEVERGLQLGERSFSIDVRFRRPDGEQVWFHMRGGAIHQGGKLVRVIGLIRDISERKQLEKMKDEFVSNVSHELRTPLASVSGSLSLLRRLPNTSHTQKEELLALAERNTERLIRLVNELLDIQRLARGEEELSKDVQSVRSFLQEALELHRSLASQCGVELRLKEAEASEALFVEIDTVRMHQVFGNLLSNAIKVSSQGHVVELSARVEEGQVVMAVKDEGPGIPSHMQERLFERFATDSSQNKQKIQGTGLGLAIARALVEAHGGTISFTTNRQQGTTFFVSLPGPA